MMNICDITDFVMRDMFQPCSKWLCRHLNVATCHTGGREGTCQNWISSRHHYGKKIICLKWPLPTLWIKLPCFINKKNIDMIVPAQEGLQKAKAPSIIEVPVLAKANSFLMKSASLTKGPSLVLGHNLLDNDSLTGLDVSVTTMGTVAAAPAEVPETESRTPTRAA